MPWSWRHRLLLYARNSVWILPSLGILAAMLVVRVVHRIDTSLGWTSSLEPDAARTVLVTLASSLFTFIVFVSSTMLLAVQLASAQLTPRVIALIFRDNVTKSSLTLFAFTFTLLVATTVRIEQAVPYLTVRLAAYSCIASLAVFFILIDHVGRTVRPNGVLRRVALRAREVIASVYPHPLTLTTRPEPHPDSVPASDPTSVVAAASDGVVLACDVSGIVTLARRHDCVVELVPQVGDFIADGDPLFRIWSRGSSPSPHALRHSVAIGHERTMEQDPAFAFRIIVDIASKALSPAINDPTTAVLAIDHLHHLLREVARRQLDDDRVRDPDGRLRLIYRTPNWDDFVHLAVTEIRQFGRESMQVTRRLHAMLEYLIQVLPEPRLPLLRQELDLIQRSATRAFEEPEDRALASESDSQGVGGRAKESRGPADSSSPH